MIKRWCVIAIVLFGVQPLLSAQANDTINEKEVSRIIHFLASDSLKGRGNGRPELLKAGLFIGDEFRRNNLQPLPGLPSYFLPFRPFGGSKKITPDRLLWNGGNFPPYQFIYVHPAPGNYTAKVLSDFDVIKLDSFFTEDILNQFPDDTSSLLIWTNRKQPDAENFFPEKIKVSSAGLKRNVLLVYAETPPDSILLTGNASYYSMEEYNVVGILTGKSKPNEVVIFSAHYDHEGVYAGRRRDSIMNGANDNASGTTALLALANYFSKRNDNKRTIMFCAFAGEELGLLGSKEFITNIINPQKIVAAINIEMIGVPQFGENRVFITGEKHSNLPDILKKDLKNNLVRVIRDPDESQELFIRSDNYSFALKGVPAHTIMASNANDKCYHQPCDEVSRINIANMTRIIKAIALSVKNLISGEKTPERIYPGDIEIKN